MKRIFLPLIALTAFTTNNFAQSNRAFAITADVKGSYIWNAIREIDLSTGEVVKTLFTPADAAKVNYQFLTADAQRNINNYQSIAPTVNGVAAAAFDAKHNRLYFSQMWNNDLRYFDLNSQQLTVVVNEDKNYSTGTRVDESNVVTRMVIAADGNGYALTNDGNQLIQFTTNDKPVITNLGALVDSKKNNAVSVHTQCTSWGGDLIADAYGNLYLFSHKGYVFKININTRIAEHIGNIKNLPAEFTINGAAVNADGGIVVSSAVKGEEYFEVNLSTLDAKPLDKKGATVYNASDLASSNLAYSAAKAVNPAVANVANPAISIYPNPAVNKNFTVQFDKVPAGVYSLEITDANGKRVITKSLTLTGLQNEKIALPKGAAAGVYLVKVATQEGKALYNEKVVVQ